MTPVKNQDYPYYQDLYRVEPGLKVNGKYRYRKSFRNNPDLKGVEILCKMKGSAQSPAHPSSKWIKTFIRKDGVLHETNLGCPWKRP
mgnify:CR=1